MPPAAPRSGCRESPRTTRTATTRSTASASPTRPTATPPPTGRPRATGAFSKPGVGLVLKVEGGTPQTLTLTTDTPGFNAEIRAGNSPDGPFDTVVAGDARTAPTTTWELGDTDARYFVVWITDLDGVAHVNEVKAS